MNAKVLALMNDLEYNLEELKSEKLETIQNAQKAIEIIFKTMSLVKKVITNSDFKSEGDEIFFFKETKPVLLSKLIYYNNIFRIEVGAPLNVDKEYKSYFKREIAKINQYFDDNKEFYKYYRQKCTYLDHIYFTRGINEFKTVNQYDPFLVEVDTNFTTFFDYKVATIIANESLLVYLLYKIKRQSSEDENNSKAVKRLMWTHNKTALIELIYALYYKGCFNNGNADIKEITNQFEEVFNVNLGDAYRTWHAIKTRKTEATIFLDELKNNLSSIIDSINSK